MMFGFLGRIFGNNSEEKCVLSKVVNTEKHARAADHYYFVELHCEEGCKNSYLFTENELNIARDRAAKNQEDIPK